MEFFPARLLQGVAEAGEAAKAGVELAVGILAMGSPEHSIETQLGIVWERRRERHAGGREPLRRNREQKGGNRLSAGGQIGQAFGEIFAAWQTRERS